MVWHPFILTMSEVVRWAGKNDKQRVGGYGGSKYKRKKHMPGKPTTATIERLSWKEGGFLPRKAGRWDRPPRDWPGTWSCLLTAEKQTHKKVGSKNRSCNNNIIQTWKIITFIGGKGLSGDMNLQIKALLPYSFLKLLWQMHTFLINMEGKGRSSAATAAEHRNTLL